MERKVHPNARITLMAFIGDRQCDSFSEGAYSYRGGLRDAVEHADDLATHGTWTTARSRDGRLYTHMALASRGVEIPTDLVLEGTTPPCRQISPPCAMPW